MRAPNTKDKLRKQTEIGEIPESWKVVELGCYSKLITKGSSPKWQGFDYCDKGILFVRSQNVGLGQLELEEIAYLPKEFNKKEEKSILQKNDLLINIVGSIGRAALADDIVEGGNVNQAVAIARLKQGVEPFFVMAFLLTLAGQLQLHRQKKVIARANLSLQDIKNLLIPLPPLPEQRAIAHVLQSIQEAKAARQREIELERERKAALMDYLFSRGTKGESRKQTEIGEIPESWEVVRLGEIVKESIKDGVHQTPTYVQDGVPFITAKDIVGNKIRFAGCTYISLEEHDTLIKRVKPEIGDVLLTKVGTIGNVALVDVSQEFSIFVQVALIKPKSDIIDSGFLLYALQSEKGQAEINRKSAQSTMRFIGVQKISTVCILLPSLPEQAEIAKILQACDTKIAALEQEAARLDELFHAMLDELMTGKRSSVPLIDSGLLQLL